MAFTCQSVHGEILKWSKSRPDWQRDAIRRLVVNGSLEPADIDDITTLCKIAHKIEDAKPGVTPIPLEEAHICADDAQGASVCLCSISQVQNVNAIASPSPLVFGESGITLVYGSNGAGKSGYVRILKSVCRARKPDARILPNVFESTLGKVPKAKISFKKGNADHIFDWEKDTPPLPELTCINVFDSECGSVYVSENNKIVYMPLGLDVFDKLAKACDAVKAKLTEERQALHSGKDELPLDYRETAIGKWYSGISQKTSPKDVEKNTSFDAEKDGKRLLELQKALVEESKTARAAELRLKKERYEQLRTRIRGIEESLSEDMINDLKDAKGALGVAVKAADLASKTAFELEPVKGVGSEAWRELWLAAKKFSETEAYPEQEFPNVGKGARCVLCFQELKPPEATERMSTFKAFVLEEASTKETEARKLFEKQQRIFSEIEISKDNDNTILKELNQDSPEMKTGIEAFIQSAKERKAKALEACDNEKWADISSLPDSGLTRLKALSDNLELQAKTLQDAENPELLPLLQAEKSELEAKRWVSDRKTKITEEITRLARIGLYDKAISGTNTAQITKMGTELTDKHVTEELKSSFLGYLDEIYKNKLKIGLEKKQGEKGATYYSIKLQGCSIPKAEIKEVISEGEFRAVALSAFLSEISMSPTKSGIVFDDPVCSLDHEIRENLAKQIVKLAKDRQVIVFTHDLFFYVTLSEAAEKQKIEPFYDYIEKDYYKGPGVCYQDMPWEAMKVNTRIKQLKVHIDEAAKKYKEGKKQEYEEKVGFICVRMRKTIERAVEEVLMCDIVHRYRRNIMAQNVTKLEKITPDDIKIIDDLMTRYSIEIHDQPEEAAAKIPTPEQLKDDVNSLEQWAKDFRSR
jgi:energy-coupling factor transporter ATP-binding protein EcfA2